MYVQNSTTGAVHQFSPKYSGRTKCGLTYDGATARSRRRIAADAFRTLPTLADIPREIICDRCLPTERRAAFNKDLIHAEVSGGELPEPVE